uniref:Ig-like domain-containing protein n=1 Tax=Leptobrachium leishanense TaxID=445787 RepID=A0A8C5PQX7_9ANUR
MTVCAPHVGDIIVPRQLQCNQSYTLQCEISEFHPDNLTVTWSKIQKGKEETIDSESKEKYYIPDLTYKKQRDHTYNCMASLVFIPSYESDHEAEFSCRVEHPSLEEPIERRTEPLEMVQTPRKPGNTGKKDKTMRPWAPRVGDIIVPRQLHSNKSYTLQCQISQFYPNSLSVTWLKKQKGEKETIRLQSSERYQIPDILQEQQEDHTYSCTARLVFTPSYESDHGAEFICRVKHSVLKEPIERRTDPLRVKNPRSWW